MPDYKLVEPIDSFVELDCMIDVDFDRVVRLVDMLERDLLVVDCMNYIRNVLELVDRQLD